MAAQVKLFQVDAFTDSLFGGNPAAVCVLDTWPSKEVLQQIASENFLPETAFLVPLEEEDHFDLKWFTPDIEMDLCGHA
ncbi:MAG TPA: PhzF family phenazine biosynthesis protein, partial [Sphingobacteriaceae bacterium]